MGQPNPCSCLWRYSWSWAFLIICMIGTYVRTSTGPCMVFLSLHPVDGYHGYQPICAYTRSRDWIDNTMVPGLMLALSSGTQPTDGPAWTADYPLADCDPLLSILNRPRQKGRGRRPLNLQLLIRNCSAVWSESRFNPLLVAQTQSYAFCARLWTVDR